MGRERLARRPRLIVSQANLAELVHEQLKAMFVVGELKPGELYSVAQLAEGFGVSRTPVREALVQLAREGLVASERNRGFRVVELGQNDFEDIFEVRLILEVAAMEIVAARALPAKAVFSQARAIYEKLQAAADKGSVVEFLRFDREFHLLLVSLAGNAWMTKILADLRDHMVLPGLRALARDQRLRSAGEEHLELLEALERGDAKSARDITARHIGRTMREWATGAEAEPLDGASGRANGRVPPLRSRVGGTNGHPRSQSPRSLHRLARADE